jgi:uncharacterized membrane protein YjfL (UPF0719 family)
VYFDAFERVIVTGDLNRPASWLFDLITPRIDVQKELSEKNVAVAVVIGALLLGIAYITAHVVQ